MATVNVMRLAALPYPQAVHADHGVIVEAADRHFIAGRVAQDRYPALALPAHRGPRVAAAGVQLAAQRRGVVAQGQAGLGVRAVDAAMALRAAFERDGMAADGPGRVLRLHAGGYEQQTEAERRENPVGT